MRLFFFDGSFTVHTRNGASPDAVKTQYLASPDAVKTQHLASPDAVKTQYLASPDAVKTQGKWLIFLYRLDFDFLT